MTSVLLQPRNLVGVRNLKDVTTASPGRVLDLHALAFDPPAEPDYLTRPLFLHPLLNRAIIAKQNIRPGEENRDQVAVPGKPASAQFSIRVS